MSEQQEIQAAMEANRCRQEFHCTLKDNNPEHQPQRTVNVRVVEENGFLQIYPEGYGEPEAAKGCGSPVFLEVYEGELRVHIKPDIQDGRQHETFSLEGAREDRVTDWES